MHKSDAITGLEIKNGIFIGPSYIFTHDSKENVKGKRIVLIVAASCARFTRAFLPMF